MRKFFTSLTTVATLTLAAIPALGLLQAAHAAERPQTTATISLVGLNLNNPAHAAEFSDRVDAAADRICRNMAGQAPGNDFTVAGCKFAARRQAVAQLSSHQRQSFEMAAHAGSTMVAAR